MLSAEKLEEFERDGIVRLPAAFTQADAAQMRAVLWAELEALYGMVPGDRTTWTTPRPVRLKVTKKDPGAAVILAPPVREALTQLLGAWVEPTHQGQVLVTMPEEQPWVVPHRMWHADVGFEIPRDRLAAVKIWALLEDLQPGGGGTPQIAGSHRVIERLLDSNPDLGRDDVLTSHEWFQQLCREDRRTEWTPAGDVDGIPVRVLELTGQAGDVYITHPWLLHSIATNARETPR
ncbi:hypothetical protein HPO96_19580 [Kribbella sandramycini]|uniref:Phytanoyl-CoA dioxygenase PhyH n=1 Tax=Kribbella sandramycini TaxID=60450 RepID=A0A7Y4NZU7_9ACTN|nr:phytanoyl-CoA dioxygenase family protein [Kribbella sandramycini]MBB6564750.1 hypothetical protein [Kribbella sandramycini]NOL42452.1 hypothetical protein [Kribbella sandramycini]